MGTSIINALQEATREELIDIIEERMYMDRDFRKVLEHRFATKNMNVEEQIRVFQRMVSDEMRYISPDTSVIRSAGFTLQRNMQTWSVVDYCRACLVIISTFDDALCNGVGMEDESDFEISMDLENASRNAVERIRTSDISDYDRQRIIHMISAELKKPLSVYGSDVFTDIRNAVTAS